MNGAGARVVLSGVGRSLGVVDLGALRDVLLVAGGRVLGHRVAAGGGDAAADLVDRRVAGAIVVDEEIDRVRQQRERKYQADHEQSDGAGALLLLARGLERGKFVPTALRRSGLGRRGLSGSGLRGRCAVGAEFSSLLAFATWVYSYRSVSGRGESISTC